MVLCLGKAITRVQFTLKHDVENQRGSFDPEGQTSRKRCLGLKWPENGLYPSAASRLVRYRIDPAHILLPLRTGDPTPLCYRLLRF